jgi:hypothetical protein
MLSGVIPRSFGFGFGVLREQSTSDPHGRPTTSYRVGGFGWCGLLGWHGAGSAKGMNAPNGTLTDLVERVLSENARTDSCWHWPGRLDRGGYGRIGRLLAHRVVYEKLRDPIPDGLTIDHLCRVRSCVNPYHMEPVSAAVNTARGQGPAGLNVHKTHCKHGHVFDEQNTRVTYQRAGWWRVCRPCHNARCRKSYHAAKALRESSRGGTSSVREVTGCGVARGRTGVLPTPPGED